MKIKGNIDYRKEGLRWDSTSFEADGRARYTHNHVGFLPNGPKRVVCHDPAAMNFEIKMITNVKGECQKEQPVKYRGNLQAAGKELGTYWLADFSELVEEGIYILICGGVESSLFRINSRIYDYPLHVLYNYFPSQRCGDSISGYNAPCHLSDAVRHDTGERIELAGGWHQSCDLRKWMFGTPFGLMGLTRLAAINRPLWDNGLIDNEIRWGNRYFFNMVRPDGGLMDHIVLPVTWHGQRLIYANDAPLSAFYLLIAAEAMCAEYYRKHDAGYAEQCLAVAKRLWDYAHGPNMAQTPYKPPVIPPHHEWIPAWLASIYPGSAIALAQELFAAVWLHRAGAENGFLEHARKTASLLVDLQVGGDIEQDLSAANFYEAPGRKFLPRHTVYYDFFTELALAEMLATDSQCPEAGRWREAVLRIAERSRAMASRNAFGVVPTYWYSSPQEGVFMRGKKTSRYRYFFKESCHLHHKGGLNNFGINHNILGHALFLLEAGKLMGNDRYYALACRQADWVLGCNPFNRSSVEGVGYNQISRLVGGDFFPDTSQIPGAVNTGITGSAERDEPQQFFGIGSEYDMPPTALLIWLLAEMQAYTPHARKDC